MALSYLSGCISKLEPNLLVDMMVYLLLEYSIIIYSSDVTLLSQVIVFLLQIIKPLRYPNPVIVNLPSQMELMLESPFPTLIGITSCKDITLQDTQLYFNLDNKTVLKKDELPKLHYVFDYLRNCLKGKYLQEGEVVKKLRYIVNEEILNQGEKQSVMSPFLELFRDTQIFRYHTQ